MLVVDRAEHEKEIMDCPPVPSNGKAARPMGCVAADLGFSPDSALCFFGRHGSRMQQRAAWIGCWGGAWFDMYY